MADGVYHFDRENVRLFGSVAAGKNITIYTTGDITIIGDITADDYNSRSSIPSVHIVAGGNIGILGKVGGSDPVSRVDAVLITKNTLSTCSTYSAESIEDIDLLSRCEGKLQINGAVLAGKVEFKRTLGTLKDSTPNEFPNGASAEVINFLPELYLAQPQGWEVPGGRSLKYDYLTSLPPIL
jgi:hypothetical protein